VYTTTVLCKAGLVRDSAVLANSIMTSIIASSSSSSSQRDIMHDADHDTTHSPLYLQCYASFSATLASQSITIGRRATLHRTLLILARIMSVCKQAESAMQCYTAALWCFIPSAPIAAMHSVRTQAIERS
jgi:hypothetical protein